LDSRRIGTGPLTSFGAISLAYAVVRGDPPDVYVAEDIDTLHRVLALEVVAATPGSTVSEGQRQRIRDALLDERWGDAVVAWMDVTGMVVDVYSSGLEIWSAARFAEPEEAGIELRLRPLFDDG
jgi:hypothetical protein